MSRLNTGDGATISATLDTSGVALALIKTLHDELDGAQGTIDRLCTQERLNFQFLERMATLEQAVQRR